MSIVALFTFGEYVLQANCLLQVTHVVQIPTYTQIQSAYLDKKQQHPIHHHRSPQNGINHLNPPPHHPLPLPLLPFRKTRSLVPPTPWNPLRPMCKPPLSPESHPLIISKSNTHLPAPTPHPPPPRPRPPRHQPPPHPHPLHRPRHLPRLPPNPLQT